MDSQDTLVLDDFRLGDGRATIGTRWAMFSDRVMGGLSTGTLGFPGEPSRLALEGQVSLENNGGFIQARLLLAADGQRFDASAYHSILLRVRGRPGPWFVNLKTDQLTRPWQSWRAPLALTADWTEHRLPFSAFEGRRTELTLDPARLTSIGLIAFGEAGHAQVELAYLALQGGA